MAFKTAWVIPTLNRPSDIERLLRSCIEQTLRPTMVIIVDGSSNSETHLVCDKFSGMIANLIYHPTKNLGSVTQRLTAFQYLQGIDYALFLDDDITLDMNAFEILVKTIESGPKQTCLELNFKTLSFGSELQRKGNIPFFNLLKMFFLLPHQSNAKKILPSGGNTWLNEYELNISDELKEVEWLSGCCMLLPLAQIKEHPCYYLNEDLQKFSGYALGEDVYLSVMLKKAGYRFYRVMNAWGTHHKSPSTRPNFEKLIAAKVYNYGIINKALGSLTRYKLAYSWSMVGTFLLSLGTCLATRTLSPIKGFVKGRQAIHLTTARPGN